MNSIPSGVSNPVGEAPKDRDRQLQWPPPRQRVPGAVAGPEAGPRASGAKRAYDLEERLIRLSLLIIDVVEALPSTRAGNHIAGQLIRCGTSPAANYGEAQSAESRSDFLHKIGVVLKELRETRVWLRIIAIRNLAAGPTVAAEPLGETSELIAIFARSIETARANQERPQSRRRV